MAFTGTFDFHGKKKNTVGEWAVGGGWVGGLVEVGGWVVGWRWEGGWEMLHLYKIFINLKLRVLMLLFYMTNPYKLVY